MLLFIRVGIKSCRPGIATIAITVVVTITTIAIIAIDAVIIIVVSTRVFFYNY